jgi:predicted transcriptional regulator
MSAQNPALSKRERQIIDALYRLGKATAVEIREAMTDPPSNTAVRTLLAILVDKGHVRYQADGIRYVYEPVVPKEQMAKSVISSVVANFFEGSVERVVATLLDSGEANLTIEQLDHLSQMIEEARRQGR